MTIKEMERVSGVARANIRYYEAEGLLHPERGENGYRIFTEADLEELKKIQLLRSLRVPIEEIRELGRGEARLSEVLGEQLKRLASEKAVLGASEEVCRVMREEKADYETLDTQRYLGLLDKLPSAAANAAKEDRLPKVRAPWRRFLARTLDLYLLEVIWGIFLGIVLNINIAERLSILRLLDLFVAEGLMLVLEPLFLHFTGTTPGKWILGLSVSSADGARLSLADAFARTFEVLSMGMGFGIPVYSLIRTWKSYSACTGGEVLSWEEDSELTLRDEKFWRWILFGACYAAAFALAAGGLYLARLPRNRGDLTRQEFCENFRRACKYYEINYQGYRLSEEGVWEKTEETEDGAIIELFPSTPQEFVFREEDGVLSAVEFTYVKGEDDVWLMNGPMNQIYISTLAFVGAQKGFEPFSAGQQEIITKIEEYDRAGAMIPFVYENHGMRVTCERISDSPYTMTFRMEKIR